MQTSRKYRWLRRLSKVKNQVIENPIASATFLSGAIGGLTLFWYCFLVGQTPNFTFSEVLGTFVATFLAGVIVIGTFSLMCIAPAAFSRYVLDEILPEQPDFQHFWLPGKRSTEPALPVILQMRAHLLKGAFPVEISLLAVLAWAHIWLGPLAKFSWPADTALLEVLYNIAFVSLLITICFGSRTPKLLALVIRYVVVFVATAAILLYLAHRVGLPSPGNLLPVNPPAITPAAQDSTHAWSMPSGIAFYGIVGLAAVTIVALIEVGRRRGSRKRRVHHGHAKTEQTRERPSMIWVRIRVAAAYVGFSILPMFAALKLAGENGPAHAVRSLALVIFYLVLFNFAFFCVASVKRSAGKAAILAVLCFIAILLIPVQLATTIPKTIVFALGLGNFHSSAVVLPASECSRLQVYGVACNAKKDEAIAITNVNVVSLLGSSAVLELQVRREGPVADALLKGGVGSDADLAIPGGVLNAASSMPTGTGGATNVLLRAGVTDNDMSTHGKETVLRPARRCDEDTAAWLREPESSKAHQQAMRAKFDRLLCVTFTVQKAELLDYDKDGWRSYRNGYTTFVGVVTPPASKEKSHELQLNGSA